MTSAISSTTQTQHVAQATTPSTPKTAQSKSQPTPTSAKDTVQLSAAAQLLLAATKEAQETPTQTAQEAQGGDHQAQRLLAQENAARATAK